MTCSGEAISHPDISTLITPTVAAPSAVTVPISPTVGPPMKRFRFSATYDLLMPKAVNAAGAHLASWGQTRSFFGKSLHTFIAAAPPGAFLQHKKPSHKSNLDRFKRVVQERREDVKATANYFGIVELFGEKERLCDDMILEMNETEEREEATKEDRNAQ